MRALALCGLLAGAAAVRVTFNNTAPRYDDQGQIMDCHDGSIQQFTPGGLYWVHCVAYGLCEAPLPYGCTQMPDKCGFRLNHNVSVYSSPNMSSGSWHFEGYAIDLDERPAGTVFRPEVAYSPATSKYVLWWNWVSPPPESKYMGYAAAVSDTPAGPFTLVEQQVNITYNNNSVTPSGSRFNAGDFHRFVDPDTGAGYVIYSSGHWMVTEELTPDLLASTGRTSPLFPLYFVEAPVLFKRAGVWWALFSHCCCFCLQGSGVTAWTAPTALGPWTQQAGPGPDNELACVNASSTSPYAAAVHAAVGLSPIPTPGQGCLYDGPSYTSVTRAQQNYVISLPSGDMIWTGDRWQQSPDGLKGHEPQAWLPLTFNADGTLAPLQWVDSFQADV